MKKYMMEADGMELGLVDTLKEARQTKKYLKSLGKDSVGYWEYNWED
jgi:hypothetical protein